MTDTSHDVSQKPLDVSQLLALLKEREEEILSLKKLADKKNASLKLDKIHTTILQVKNDMARLESALNEYRREYRKNNQTLLEIIRGLERVLYSHGLINKIKTFVRPRIGVLYQYNHSRPLTIPKHYKKPIPLKNPPTISIITPSFNQGIFIEKTIQSILNQNYPALEFIIQDNASTDDTIKIIEFYKPHLKHWESAKDTGQSNAINKGFSHSSGEIMAYLNSDDILLPGTLAYVAQYFNHHPEVDVVYGHRILINDKGQEVGRWVLPQHNYKVLTWADYVPQETLFWRRSIWDKAGGKVDESFQFAMDWDLLLRFQEAGARFIRLPRFLGAFRVHQHQKTATSISEAGEKEMELLRTRCHGRLVTPKEVNKNLRWYLTQHLLYHKLHRVGLLRY